MATTNATMVIVKSITPVHRKTWTCARKSSVSTTATGMMRFHDGTTIMR